MQPFDRNTRQRASLLALLISLVLPHAVSAAAPDIVIVLADDLGYGDVGAYGGTTIATPHIDALAAGGVRFTNGYVTHPVCSPSRAGLVTGRYQQRHGWEFNPAGRDARAGLSVDESTLGDRLREVGYETALIGKWHLGKRPEHHPLERGFDHYFGVLEGGSTFIDSRVPGTEYASLRGEPAPTERPNAVLDGRTPVRVEEYLTDRFTDEALKVLETPRERPVFVLLSHTTPHTPLQATADFLAPYRHLEPAARRVYAAMVASLDQSVGRLVSSLRKRSRLRNTLIVFLSDNGCAGYIHGACSNAPLRGFKRHHHDGGVRVPFILYWPEALAPGHQFDHPVSALDLTDTLLAAATGKPSDATADSVNLLPHINGEIDEAPHEMLFWRSGHTLAVRSGRWKLLRHPATERRVSELDFAQRITPPDGGWRMDEPPRYVVALYDLASDIGEQVNLADRHPRRVKRLLRAAEQWSAALSDPILPPVRSTLIEMHGDTAHLLF